MTNAFSTYFESAKARITALGFKVISEDANRPWGGFLVIDEQQAAAFCNHFFSGEALKTDQKLSPKILLVAPQQRLSWQYHHRRSEVWKALEGTLWIARSLKDEIPPTTVFEIDSIVYLKKGERHRLIGGASPGMVAEIWQHTDPKAPSNEEDIVRLQDDYQR